MRYIGIIILLVLCLTLLLFTGCMINTVTPEIDMGNFGNQEGINTVTPEIASGNLENQEDINQSSNNSQGSSSGSVEEPVIEDIEEPAEEPAEEPGTVYPQQWATGDGTAENPWANDCIQKAYNNVPDGGTIFLKAGYYELSASLKIAKRVNIIGEGMGGTIIKTANADGFSVDTDYFTIKDLTVDGDAQTENQQYLSCIRIGTYSEYALFENIEVKNAGYYGINVYEVNNSLFQNIYAHDNYRHGLHPGADTAGLNKYNTYRDIYAWDNGQLGFADRGTSTGAEETHNIYDNIQCWDNGSYGMQIFRQKGIVLTNSIAWGNSLEGISIEEVEDSTISDCLITLNGGATESGIMILLSDNVSLTNIIAKNNHVGIIIWDSSNIILTSCQSYDDRETPEQNWGLTLYGSNTGISLLNCKLSPNAVGDIYNPNGAVIAVITEKMFAKF